MAALASGIFNQSMTAAQALSGASPNPMSSSTANATGTSSTSGTASSSATISSNDFLTLLVTEMQNQDPTATTDPNEYINQLVNVNSLEQLISINQTLSGALGTGATTASNGSAQTNTASSPVNGTDAFGVASQVSSAASSKGGTLASEGVAGHLGAISSAARHVSGNLSVPDANPAANTVAHALSGQLHTGSIAGGLHGAQ